MVDAREFAACQLRPSITISGSVARIWPAGGRSLEQARELWRQAAQDASLCADCFRPLAPAESVTMQRFNIGYPRSNPIWVRVPVCLLCTLDCVAAWRLPGTAGFYDAPRWRRTRCVNCDRPIWTRSYGLSARTCCADCYRLAHNQRNRLRRRVVQQAVVCVECKRSFVPRRADARTCSDKCRRAHHRRQ